MPVIPTVANAMKSSRERPEGNMATSTLRRKVGIETGQCLTNAAMLGEHIVRRHGQYLIVGAVACALCEQTCGGGERGKAQAARGSGKILRKTSGLAPIFFVRGGRKRGRQFFSGMKIGLQNVDERLESEGLLKLGNGFGVDRGI